MSTITRRLAEELSVAPGQIEATTQLLDQGNTVPFIARYRKEVTGGLDDTQLRALEERLRYLRELEDRRTTILESIAEQDRLTPELEQALRSAETKSRLEDLYLPFRPRRRTRAQIAREAGLEPLARHLFEYPDQDPEQAAAAHVDAERGVADTRAALEGARQILMEQFSEDADLLAELRQLLWTEGLLSSRVVPDKEQEGQKFSDYFEHDEPLQHTPSHRALAMFRGRREGVLSLAIRLPDEEELPVHPAQARIATHWGICDRGRPADPWLAEVVRWTWRVRLYTHLETDLLGQLRERSEEEAIAVFAANLKDLLLAAPAGPRPTMGLDPGLRTGVKVAVVDATGKLVDHATVYPHPPQQRSREARAVLARLIRQHGVELVAIGNGTASRETDRLVASLQAEQPEPAFVRVIVNEAGASVYSASEYAAREFPDLDVSLRGAASIARRLQDPLAELVKIDPRSIGVGQYQHDVSQLALSRSLDAVVEDCVNAVGVDVNTASPALLSRVAGLNEGLAGRIVEHRNQQGAFASRRQLLDVPRLGPKTFEQAAGFLRIMQGDQPLDASAVHPEAYAVVEQIARHHGRPLASLIGDSEFLRQVNPADYTSEAFGLPTVMDILQELDKPGRDPRPEFRTAALTEGVEKLTDLEPNLILEGTVTNVTHFGAFVDIGVHQDGLVHISALSHRFVKDPREVVKAGDIVRVKVMEVDEKRRRIALSMRLDDEAGDQERPRAPDRRPRRERAPRRSRAQGKPADGALAQALSQALKKD